MELAGVGCASSAHELEAVAVDANGEKRVKSAVS